MTELVQLPELDIVRHWSVPVRADAADGGEGLGSMEVRFSTFDSWYEINSFWEGRFLERTVKGAFRKTIKENRSSVKVLFNHGGDFSIGDKILGTVESLSEEDDSPLGVVSLFDTSYNRDLLPGLRAGAYGSSFMFRVVKDSWNNEPGVSEHNPEGLPERTIKEVRLFEFGPVTWPANPASTSGMRCASGTDAYYESLRAREPQRVDELRSALTHIRTPAEVEPPLALDDEGAAPQETAEPAERHSGGLTPAQRRERLFPYLKDAS